MNFELQSSGPFFLLIISDTLFILILLSKCIAKSLQWALQNHALFLFFIKKYAFICLVIICKYILHVLKIKVNFYKYVNWTCQITFGRNLGCFLECSQIFIYKLNTIYLHMDYRLLALHKSQTGLWTWNEYWSILNEINFSNANFCYPFLMKHE